MAERDKYKLITKLGQGGMSSVMLTATAGPDDVRKLLVIKKLLPGLASDDEFVKMFMNEARIAARLNHPNVISTFEVGSAADGPFIVMEYLDGQSLSSILRRLGHAGFPLPYQLCVLRGLLSGLDYAHSLTNFDGRPLNLVHRDVSPPNAVVCYDGQVKLVDFGIAKAAGFVGNTQPGLFKGKVAYTAPEHILGQALDRRADIFSAGAMLWETIAGRKLSQELSDAEILRQRTRGKIPDFGRPDQEPHPELVAICHRALAFSPDARFPSAGAMLSALDEFIAKHGMRVDDRAMGRVVASHFEDHRTRIRRLIEAHMAPLSSSSRETEIDDLLAEIGRSASAEMEPSPVGGSTFDLVSSPAVPSAAELSASSDKGRELGKTTFVQSPLHPSEQLSRSRSSVPVQMSMRPAASAPEAAAAGRSRQPWAFVAGASIVGLLLIAGVVRVKQRPVASAAPPMHHEELTALPPPRQPPPAPAMLQPPGPPATPVRTSEPETVGIRTSDLAKSDPTPPQRTANSAPARLRPSLAAVPAKAPRLATALPAANLYDIELHENTRKAPRTIDEVNPY